MPSPLWGLFVRSEYRRMKLENNLFENVGGYFVPSDPMDGLVCESCE